jgi:hypothetical protein
MNGLNIKDYIISFYSKKNSYKPVLHEKINTNHVFSFNVGVGDMVILNSILFNNKNEFSNKNIFSPSPHFEQVGLFNKYFKFNKFDNNSRECVRMELLEFYNLGGGHLIDRIRNGLNMPRLQKPQGFLVTDRNKIKNKIGICLSTGKSAFALSGINKNPRQIYSCNLEIIKKFIADYSNKYSFVEFGNESLNLGCQDFCNKSIAESISELSTCEYFIGLNSGFMNLAACFDIKSIIILNIPIDAHSIVLPCLVDVDVPDLNWLYPQNVHLHQDSESLTCPIFNRENLLKALNGEVYPYWSEEYLDLTR